MFDRQLKWCATLPHQLPKAEFKQTIKLRFIQNQNEASNSKQSV